MQFEFRPAPGYGESTEQLLTLSEGPIPVLMRRNPRARRYILRIDRHGRAKLTIPRRGTASEAWRFAEKQKGWIELQLRRLASAPKQVREWMLGSEVLFRGEITRIESVISDQGRVRLGTEMISVTDSGGDLRPALELHLRKIAASELPPRVLGFAVTHGLRMHRVCIRDQKSRWGSCSRRGAISLNWRLIQAPQHVCDYIILHELMHLRQMNHSARFWREVERVCPHYAIAERWLKQHSGLLRER